MAQVYEESVECEQEYKLFTLLKYDELLFRGFDADIPKNGHLIIKLFEGNERENY